LHYFSRLNPSGLLGDLCSVLTSLGVHKHIIGEEKMKVTFLKEEALKVM